MTTPPETDARVSDELVERAARRFFEVQHSGLPTESDEQAYAENEVVYSMLMRAALEAVAPALIASRVTEEALPTIQLAGGFSPLRYGQALFNDLYRVAPDIADRIRSTENDSFYQDERVPAFLAALIATAGHAGEERARRECAEELRAALTTGPIGGRSGERYVPAWGLRALADSWFAPAPPSGAGEEGGTG